jgi:hypothetical protein
MFTDELDLTALHEMAADIGMKHSWFQDKQRTAPHYDLTAARRADAVRRGAIEVDRAGAVAIWKARRELVAASANSSVETKLEGA